jgi:hypothetical protein
MRASPLPDQAWLGDELDVRDELGATAATLGISCTVLRVAFRNVMSYRVLDLATGEADIAFRASEPKDDALVGGRTV